MKKIFILTLFALAITAYDAKAETKRENTDQEIIEKIGDEIDSIVSENQPHVISSSENEGLRDPITLEEAQTPSVPISEDDDANFSYNLKGSNAVPDSEFKVFLPDCNDKKLLELVRTHIVAYQNRNPAETIVGKRKQLLMLKRISSLDDVSPENITSKDDIRLANEIIMLKINKGIPAMNIRVCKGPKANNDLYLYVISYNDGKFTTNKIINFADEGSKEQNLEFLY